MSRSNLQYILETVKDIGEKLPRRKSIVRKASFLLYNTIAMHPFLNGNKRTGYELARVFLRINGYDLVTETEKAYLFLLRIAQGKASVKDVEKWIASHLTEKRE